MCQQLCTAPPRLGENPIAIPAPGPCRRNRFTLRLNTTWISAGIGVVILIVSMAMMAYSAPGRAATPGRPAAAHGSVHLPPQPGRVPVAVPGHPRGSELRPSR